MHIWTISLFEPTPVDEATPMRFMGLAAAANRLGHRVTHFTSTFRHTSKKQRYDRDHVHTVNPDYDLVFVHSQGYTKNISLERFMAHRDFALKLMPVLKARPERPDVIFISMPPLSTVERVTAWARAEGIPVVTDIIDPWPDSFIKDVPAQGKGAARVALTPFYQRLKGFLRNSSGLTAISKGYLDWALSFYARVSNTAFFYPATDLKEVQESIQTHQKSLDRSGDVLRIIYAGSMASSYDIPSILQAAAQMHQRHPGRTEFVIAGTGPQQHLVEEYLERIPNLRYLGWVGKEELRKQYARCDLGLIQHMNSLTQTVTYKLFNYLSAGLPVLNSLQSEMVDIIRDNEVGLNNKEGDVATLVSNIEQFLEDEAMLERYKQNALTLTAREGDAPVVYGRLVAFLEDVAGQARSASVLTSQKTAS